MAHANGQLQTDVRYIFFSFISLIFFFSYLFASFFLAKGRGRRVHELSRAATALQRRSMAASPKRVLSPDHCGGLLGKEPTAAGEQQQHRSWGLPGKLECASHHRLPQRPSTSGNLRWPFSSSVGAGTRAVQASPREEHGGVPGKLNAVRVPSAAIPCRAYLPPATASCAFPHTVASRRPPNHSTMAASALKRVLPPPARVSCLMKCTVCRCTGRDARGSSRPRQ